jgi:two-component system OmpR family response regulator
MRHILVADDDPHILDIIGFALEKAGMRTTLTDSGQKALDAFNAHAPDLVVLDINMPDRDGLDVCRTIRKASDVPILFLSSRDDEIDRILGLEIGGDDYVTKPFSPRELVARINVILKRARPSATPEPAILSHGLLEINPQRHAATWNGHAVKLTAIEFAILAMLTRQPGRVFTRDNIMDAAYSQDVVISDRTIDSHVRHIRQKFLEAGCPNLIETVHGVGYALAPCA